MFALPMQRYETFPQRLVCINCFGHVVANTFSGNFRYFIVIHFISYKII